MKKIELRELHSSSFRKRSKFLLTGMPQLPPLRIDRQVLETVRESKVQGVVIQENLKWHELICMIVSKANHLHISCVIYRGGVSQVQWTLLLSASLSYVPSKTTLLRGLI